MDVNQKSGRNLGVTRAALSQPPTMATARVMEAAERANLEARLRAMCTDGDFGGAATLALRGYGSEVYGFLVVATSSPTDADDVFSELAQGLWQGLPAFAWESTLRTWMYAIARNLLRVRRREAAQGRRKAARMGESALENVAQAVRTETLAFLRTEKRTSLQALRDRLDPEERMLLVLRVDRRLSWNDLARILNDEAGRAALDGPALAKEAARWRKRFQLVKERLRKLARKEGLLE
jgi:RNA polymerase sigma-70 factor, ECF subfamily